MSGKLILQAKVEQDLDEVAAKKLKNSIIQQLEDLDSLSNMRVFYQKETGTVAVGAAVDKNLEELSPDPGSGEYLAIFIISDSKEIISEKFISNPALKQERGRFGLMLTILKRNGVKRLLLPKQPSAQQKMLLEDIGFECIVSPTERIEEVRPDLPEMVDSKKSL